MVRFPPRVTPSPIQGKNILGHLRRIYLAVLSESLRVRSIPLTGKNGSPSYEVIFWTKQTPQILLEPSNTQVQVTIVNTALIVAVFFLQEFSVSFGEAVSFGESFIR